MLVGQFGSKCGEVTGLMGRHAIEDVVIGDYEVAAGTLVIMSQYIVHNDPRWWREPLKFNPHRWLEEPQPARPKFAYFPFGGGARICAGEAFAWMEGVLLLASLVRRWKFSICQSTDDPPSLLPEITLSPERGMTLRLDAL